MGFWKTHFSLLEPMRYQCPTTVYEGTVTEGALMADTPAAEKMSP